MLESWPPARGMASARNHDMPTTSTSDDLRVEREYAGSAQAVYDAFFAMHGEERPHWIVNSDLDLRVGGTWTVTFHPPRLAPFQEVRVFSVVEPPHHIAYAMTVVSSSKPGFKTNVKIGISEQRAGTRLTLEQRGFPSSELRDEFAAAWPAVLENVEQYLPVA